MGIINNLKGGDKNSPTEKIKKFLLKRLKGLVRPFLIIGILVVIILLFILGVFDLGIELGAGKNNPELVYETFEIENVAELVEIKEDGNGGYYLDFTDEIDDKLQEIIDKANSGDYHNLPNDINFLKKMLKAEVYTQFPDLGGTVPDGTDGFQGAVQIRRVTPNKSVGEMKNTGKGETSNLEQGTVNEPINIEDRNDQNKVDSWQSGQRLKVTVVETYIYEDQYDAEYWQPILEEGSVTREVTLKKDEEVTYLGEYKIHNNPLTGQQTIYLKIKTDDGLEGYLSTSTVIAVIDGTEEGQVVNRTNTKLATTSRAEDTREEIGIEGEEYVVAIAAGRNNNDDLGIINEEKGLVEEELTIQVAEKVEELLGEYSNIRVVQTGSTSDNPDGVKPEDRAEKTRDANPDLCIQIYFGDGNEVGVQTIYKEGDQLSQQFADILSENISSSMGLENLLSIADTAKCVDADGKSSSLNIIDNSVVAGFPSVVVLGGNLSKDPDASVIAEGGVDKYAQGIVDSIDKYFQTDHSGIISTNPGETTYTTSVESRIINMKYVSQEQMQEYVDNGNIEEAIKSYTLDDDRNVVVASWSQKEDGSVEIKTNNSMNLKTALEKYMMPYEYLLYFYIDTDYKDFVEDLADEVMNSEIVVAVQDEITTTKTDEYKDQRIEATLSDKTTEYPSEPTLSRSFITENVSTKVNLTYVSTWCVKSYQENSYSETVLELGDEEEKIIEVPGKVTASGPMGTSVEQVIEDNVQETETRQKRDENNNVVVDENGEPVYETINYTYDVIERTITDVSTISNNYEKGEYKTEGRENTFVKLYNDHHMIAKVRTEGYLFQIIENNERTANLLDLTKYLIYKATNVPYGVLSFDFEEYSLSAFANVSSGIYGGTIQEKVWFALRDLGYSEIVVAGAMGNIHHESGGFNASIVEGGSGEGIGLIQWSFGRRTQLEAYAASKGVGWQDENTQIEFLVAEISGQGPAANYASKRTQGYILEEGIISTHDDWANSTTLEDSTLHFMRFFESPRSRESYSTRLEWAYTYYEEFKGRTKPSGGNIIETARAVAQYMIDNNIQYGAQTYGDIEKTATSDTSFVCATYVSVVLYESGLLTADQINAYNYHWTGSGGVGDMLEAAGWQRVSASEAQPGDVCVDLTVHAFIYAGGDLIYDEYCAQGLSSIEPYSNWSNYSGKSSLQVWRAP